MEDRERKWIKKNLPHLIKNTNCNVLLLSYLQSKDIISSSDVEDIIAKTGDLAKAKKLYQILPKRVGSFDILLEALEHVRQTGALAILQELAGPKYVLNPQRMFVSAGENVVSFLENKKYNTLVISGTSRNMIIDKILQNIARSVLLSSSDILMQNFELKPWIQTVLVDLDEKWRQVLKKLANYKGLKLIFVACTNNKKLLETIQSKYKGKIIYQKESTCWADLSPSFQLELANKVKQKCFGVDVSNILGQLEENRLLELINDKECDFFTSGIQSVTSYYIDRTILYKNAISFSIFTNQMPDIWIFKNMKTGEIESLAKDIQYDFTSNQIHESFITCRFLVLDFDTDFECICTKTKFPVHLIEKVGNNLYWKKSRGSLTTLLDCIEESILSELSEAAMIETFERNQSAIGNTIIISDTPGMGKSLLLESLGRRLAKHYPDRMVIYVVWSEFIDRISTASILHIDNILQVLAKMICKNQLSESIFQHIAPRLHIDLLLDGFDEIKPEKIQAAIDFLSKFNEDMPRVRKWVTTRPHYKKQLEEYCCTIAYQIAPFNEQNQVQFLNSYWMHSFATSQASTSLPNVSGNQIQISLNVNLLKDFTKHCLHDIKNCLNQRDIDIVGIPLQCMLVAEALQEDAYRYSKTNNCININSLKYSLPINSISELYRLFVSTKIKYYLMRTKNSKIDLQTLEMVHCYYSMLLLFPQHAGKFYLQDSLKYVKATDYLAVGILQATNVSSSPRFIHRTFAEYFVSEFCIKRMQQPLISSYFLEFFLETVLNTELMLISIPHIGNFNTACFHEKTLCHFLNSSLEIVIKSDSLSYLIEVLDRLYSTPMLVRLITHASAVDNFANIFNFLAVTKAFHCHHNHLVLDKYYFHISVFKSALGYIEACLKLYDSFQQQICYQFDDTNLCDTSYALSETLKQTVVKSWLFHNTSESGHISLLHTSMKRGDSSIVAFLVEHTGYKNVLKDCPPDLQNLLHFVVENTLLDSNDKIESRSAIINKLVQLNQEFSRYKFEGRQAILSDRVHVRLIEELLAVGADTLCEDTMKNTVWHLAAARSSCSDFYRLLTGITCWTMRSKIVNAKNQNENTVLQILVESCSPEEQTLQLLKQCGADFNTRNVLGFTPIFTVVSADEDPKIIRTLLKYGADITSTIISGLGIIHYAALLGNVQAIHTLSTLSWDEYGISNIFAWKDANGRTPLYYAQMQSPGEFVYGKQLCLDLLYAGCNDLELFYPEYSSNEDLCTTVPSTSIKMFNESWEFFLVALLHNRKLGDVFRLILFQSNEQRYTSVDFKSGEKHVTLYLYDRKNSIHKIERKRDFNGLTPLLECISTLASFLGFSLGYLKVLSSAASSDIIGNSMVSWILDQTLDDDLLVAF